MKRFIPIILALSLFLSSCGALGAAAPAADATPTMSVEQIRATADALVYEMLTQTAAAMPTNTPALPTETPLPPTATATATLVPTAVEPTPDGSVDAAAVSPTAAIIPTNTAAASSSLFPCTEKPLTSWDVPSVNISFVNTVKDTNASVFLCIITADDAGYISIPAGASAQVPYGYVTATAWVTGKKSFNDTIGFEIKTPGSLKMIVENGQLFVRASCYPNC